jgi:hypothetical protein
MQQQKQRGEKRRGIHISADKEISDFKTRLEIAEKGADNFSPFKTPKVDLQSQHSSDVERS